MSASSWASQSKDPNAPAVLAVRARLLADARRPPVEHRVEYLTDLARDKRVLDIGIVEHSVESSARHRWLHGRLSSVSSHCLGVDVLADAVEHLGGLGFDARVHDITAAPLDDEFDLVVAGEVIEHVGAPEALLRNSAAMLASNGRLVVTTPNPYMMNRAIHGLRGAYPDSADHVALFGPSQMFELAERAGLRLETWRGVRLPVLSSPRGRVVSHSRRILSRCLGTLESDCDPIIYEFVLGDTCR